MIRRSIVLLSFLVSACSSGVPHPSAATQPLGAFVEVDFPPPPARVEFVPVQPTKAARWVNGEWQWTGQRWAWKQGAWIVPPEGAGFAKAALLRRADGKLLFAPGIWRNARGEEIGAPGADNSDGGVGDCSDTTTEEDDAGTTGEGKTKAGSLADAGGAPDGESPDAEIANGAIATKAD